MSHHSRSFRRRDAGRSFRGPPLHILRLIAQASDGLHSVADVVGDGAAEAHEVVDADEQSVRGDLVLMLFSRAAFSDPL
jgi:hypothetical protein